MSKEDRLCIYSSEYADSEEYDDEYYDECDDEYDDLLPEYYSHKQIKKMYAQLRPRLSGSQMDELRKILSAVANFYLIIPLREVFKVFSTVNSAKKIDEGDFVEFAKVLQHDEKPSEIPGYEIIDSEKLLRNEASENTSFLDSLLVSGLLFESFYDDDPGYLYEVLSRYKRIDDFYIPERSELLKYEKNCEFLETPKHTKLFSYLKDRFKINNGFMEDVRIGLYLKFTDPRNNPLDYLSDSELSRIIFNECNIDEIKMITELILNAYNSMRLPAYHGFTLAEYREKVKEKYPKQEAEQIILNTTPGKHTPLNHDRVDELGRLCADEITCVAMREYLRRQVGDECLEKMDEELRGRSD